MPRASLRALKVLPVTLGPESMMSGAKRPLTARR
jgi:hypothetical protein